MGAVCPPLDCFFARRDAELMNREDAKDAKARGEEEGRRWVILYTYRFIFICLMKTPSIYSLNLQDLIQSSQVG